ncbi:MAG: YqgE/AlgH family protein [Candidatus Sulfobium sp.]|jgi:putative transcriptional regulator
MRGSFPGKKYFYVFFAVVILPVAVFAAVIYCRGEASGAESSAFAEYLKVSRDPLAGPFTVEEGLSPGKLLVASRSIGDPRFRETVILLVRYDSNGAMGLILNLPTGITLSSALPKISELRKSNDKVFIGGPVGSDQLFLLIRTDKAPEGSFRVFKKTYLSTSVKTLKRMAVARKKGERFRAFAGYAGWSRGQLQREVAAGSWHVMEAGEKLIFDKEPSALWQELISRRSGIMVRFLPGEDTVVPGFRSDRNHSSLNPG